MEGFARACEAILAAPTREAKVQAAARWLSELDPAAFPLAAAMLLGAPLARRDPRRLSLGHTLLVRAGVHLSGWDEDTVRSCVGAASDAAEALGLLAPLEGSEALSLEEVRRACESLALTRAGSRRLELLVSTLRRMKPLERKWFVRLAMPSMRLGWQQRHWAEAVGRVTGREAGEVLEALLFSGDPEAVAQAARKGRLGELPLSLFHPLELMRDSLLEAPEELEDPAHWWAEPRVDGLRVQVHVAEGQVALLTRSGAELSGRSGALVSSLRALPGPLLIDGALVAREGEKALSGIELRARLAAGESPELELVCWDLLLEGSERLWKAPVEERRRRLEALVAGLSRVSVPQRFGMETHAELKGLFEQLSQGEQASGLVLKRRASEAGFGRREWLRLQKTRSTLDAVVTAVGPGEEGRLDFTLALRSGEGLVNVARVVEPRLEGDSRGELMRLLEGLTVERYGRVQVLRPELVVEVAFESVQKSRRHRAGLALKEARITRLKPTSALHEADTIERIESISHFVLPVGNTTTRSGTELHSLIRFNSVDDLPLFTRK